jgi:hypothetical protein
VNVEIKIKIETEILISRIESALEIMRRARTSIMKVNIERSMARRKPRHERLE